MRRMHFSDDNIEKEDTRYGDTEDHKESTEGGYCEERK